MDELSVVESSNLILTMTATVTLVLTLQTIMIGLNLASKALPLNNDIELPRIVEIAFVTMAWLKRQILPIMNVQLRVQKRKQKGCFSRIHYPHLKDNSRSSRMRMRKRTNDEYNKRLRRKG
jgi:hypothetical protein